MLEERPIRVIIQADSIIKIMIAIENAFSQKHG